MASVYLERLICVLYMVLGVVFMTWSYKRPRGRKLTLLVGTASALFAIWMFAKSWTR